MTRAPRNLIANFAIAFALAGDPALASTNTGRASVIDGDTIEIHGERIRLFGIDSPESNQLCETNGRRWRCGQEATWYLDGLTAGRVVACEVVDRDRYGRAVAHCYVDELSLNEAMLSSGWAITYRCYARAWLARFMALEDDAAENRRGMWSGNFEPPWVHRWRANQNRPLRDCERHPVLGPFPNAAAQE